jgi:hypothetical protein
MSIASQLHLRSLLFHASVRSATGNRQFDMLQIIEERPELLGISVDEDTALVVSGSHCEVLGRTYVAFYVSEQWKSAPCRGSTPWSGRPFILLKEGETFDLTARQPVKWDSGGLSSARWERVLADPALAELLAEGDHMRAIADGFRFNPSKAVRLHNCI